MPRYFFHVHNGIGLMEDEGGRHLGDLQRARAEAVKGIRSILSEEVMKGHIDLRGRIEIADETGSVILRIPFEEAFVTTRGSL